MKTFKQFSHEKIDEAVLDIVQGMGDAVGVVDPTGVVDVANAGVSVVRGALEKDPKKKKEHMKNAGLRAISAIPVVGDAAKAGIYGQKALNIASKPNVQKVLKNPHFLKLANKAGQMAKSQTASQAEL